MIFRVRHYNTGGGHVYCRLYVAPAKNLTFAQAGHFTLRAEEFSQLRLRFEAEFVSDDPVKRAQVRAQALQAG